MTVEPTEASCIISNISDSLSTNATITQCLTVDVHAFGAIGDGVTDDTAAIQQAIGNASYGSVICFDGSKSYYVVGPIFLKSGITLLGYNSTVLSPWTTTITDIFNGNSSTLIKDVTIKGFRIRGVSSTRDHVETGQDYNRTGIHFSNATNITIEDISGEYLEFLIKTDLNNFDFKVNNITTASVYVPVYMAQMTKLRGRNWYMDCPTDGSPHDHHIYFNEGVVDVTVEDITCLNGTGTGAITIQNSNNSPLVTRGVTLKNIRLYNIGGDGIIVAGGNLYDIRLDGISGVGNSEGRHWFVVGWGNTGMAIEGVTFSNFHFENSGGGLFACAVSNGVYPSGVKIEHGRIQGKFGKSSAILPGGCHNLLVDDITFTDATGISPQPVVFVNTGTGNGFTMKMTNCQFLFPNGMNVIPISIRSNADYELVVEGCTFNNSGPTYNNGICYNFGGGIVLFEGNTFSGITNIRYTSDTTTVANYNFNITAKAMVLGNNASKITFGSTIPAAGAWAVGDLRYNTNPTIGNPYGWICTAAGTPGTWQPFGIIGATKLSSQSDSTAVNAITLRTDFNALLAKLRTAGLM